MTLAERLRAAANAANIRSKVTRNHLDGLVRWKGRQSHIGPYLLRVLQVGPETWFACAVERVESEGGSFSYSKTGDAIATAGSTDDAIRAGLIALAEREEARG